MKQFEAIERGIAPRMAAAWEAITDVLADGKWHNQVELVEAATATGVVEKTAQNLLSAARRENASGLDWVNKSTVPRRYEFWYQKARAATGDAGQGDPGSTAQVGAGVSGRGQETSTAGHEGQGRSSQVRQQGDQR